MKKAIIIGATSGIGKAVAEILLQEGYLVGVTGRREDLFAAMQQQFSGRIFCKKMDVQELLTLASICNELVNQMGGMDLLVISAGIGEGNKQLDFEIENDVIQTNIQGFTCIADWGTSFFKKQGYGHLVNISSIAGIRGNGLAPSYNATKAYQINYLEGLRLNTIKSGYDITVTDVRPGFVDTAMAKGNGLFWVAPVKKAAEQIVEAIKRKKGVVYITKRWGLIGYVLKIIPFSILRRV
ncbi:MAG: SDR family NAD(P)-dependent oxidoreductase [Bacteroidetes bacterium]|nr:SDR family NAD(P)-dependent oxidoreductase [Bacteroidota bacterium]